MPKQSTTHLPVTWRTCMEIIIMLLEDGTPEGKEGARVELRQLADQLDRVIAASES